MVVMGTRCSTCDMTRSSSRTVSYINPSRDVAWSTRYICTYIHGDRYPKVRGYHHLRVWNGLKYSFWMWHITKTNKSWELKFRLESLNFIPPWSSVSSSYFRERDMCMMKLDERWVGSRWCRSDVWLPSSYLMCPVKCPGEICK